MNRLARLVNSALLVPLLLLGLASGSRAQDAPKPEETKVTRDGSLVTLFHPVPSLTGDASLWLNTDKPAVNFIAAAYDDAKEKPDAEKLTIRVTRAFLGLRIDCAQCHDHFLEKSWKQTHFQALAAFFGQTRHIVTHISDGEGVYQFEDRVHGGTREIDPDVPFLPELLPAEGTRRERLAAWVTDPRNTYFARATVNRVWAMMFGRPIVAPLLAVPPEAVRSRSRISSRLRELCARSGCAHAAPLCISSAARAAACATSAGCTSTERAAHVAPLRQGHRARVA